MLGILLIIVLAALITFTSFLYQPRPVKQEQHSARYDMQMRKLWNVAQTSMKSSKTFRAEKALLTILKFDEKNAAAYNRLGILYAKSNRYDDAIECFEIAQSLDSNPSSLHNVGLIYLETGAYEKAEMAFEQAIEAEGDIPVRFIALAKAKEKLGKRKEAIDALESAYELKSDISVLRQILALYEAADDQIGISSTMARIEAQIAETAAKKASTKKSRSTTGARSNATARSASKAAARLASVRPARSRSTATMPSTTAKAIPARSAAPKPSSARPASAKPASTQNVRPRRMIQ